MWEENDPHWITIKQAIYISHFKRGKEKIKVKWSVSESQPILHIKLNVRESQPILHIKCSRYQNHRWEKKCWKYMTAD